MAWLLQKPMTNRLEFWKVFGFIRDDYWLCPRIGFVAQISIIWDSRHESRVIVGVYEQLDTYDVQDPELGRV